MASDALATEPLSNGGCGSYSMPSWIACAISSPATCAARRNAMSIPDDTPAAVMILPCSTTRSDVGVAPNSFSMSSAAQCVVAFFPCSSPAAPSSSEPVHTDVVHVLPASIARIHSSVASSSMSGRVPMPPGTTRMSALVTSLVAKSAVRPSMSCSVRYTPRSAATNFTCAPGRRCRTS